MHLRSLRFSKELVSQNYTEDATDSNNPNVNLSSPDANWENYQKKKSENCRNSGTEKRQFKLIKFYKNKKIIIIFAKFFHNNYKNMF